MLPFASQTLRSKPLRTGVLCAALFVTLYVAGAELGHWLSIPGYFATFWPPSGIFLAALLRTPVQKWPIVILLALVSSLISDVGLHACSIPLSLGFWAVTSAEALAGAWLLRRLIKSPINCESLRDVLAVVMVAGVLTTMVGGTLGALLITQAFTGESYTTVWHLWWISDLLGVVVFTPFALTLTVPGKKWRTLNSPSRALEAGLAMACLIYASQMVYGPDQQPVAFIVFPILIWIALRFEIRVICMANLVRTIVAVWNTQQGLGPFIGMANVADPILQLQVFLSLTSGSFLVLAAVVWERHQAAHILRESEARYRDLLENMDDLVDSVASDGSIVYANRAWRDTLGYSEDEIQTLSIFDVIHPDDRSQFRQQLEQLMLGENLEQMELRFITRSGRTLIVEGNSNVRFLDGLPATTRSIFRDITSRREHESQLDSYRLRLEIANRQLLLLATTDPLTGLQNRRAFQERLTIEVERAQRYGAPVSLLLLDVDHFKHFNDSFGHLVGDEVLKRVSRILEFNARTTDYVARYGGEEFAIILPNTDSSGAFALAERFRQAIASEPFPESRITASLGMATLGANTLLKSNQNDGRFLIKAADEALYFSKSHGRNQVNAAENLHRALACRA